MIETAAHGARDADTESVAEKRDNRSEHLANERTHLAYLRTAISLISLGITVNRFSLYLKEHDQLPSRPGRLDVLGGAASAGIGMVVYALVLMLAALYRYKAVERAIDHGDFHPDSPIVTWLTYSVIAAGVGGILWMFRR